MSDPLTKGGTVVTESWMGQLADEAVGVAYDELVGYLLNYVAAIGRGPAFLAWFRGRREEEKRAAK